MSTGREGPRGPWGAHAVDGSSDEPSAGVRWNMWVPEDGVTVVGGALAPLVWEPRWIRWLTMMLFPKPPMDAMVVLCSRCTTAVIPPSAISLRILARASSPEPTSGGKTRQLHTAQTAPSSTEHLLYRTSEERCVRADLTSTYCWSVRPSSGPDQMAARGSALFNIPVLDVDTLASAGTSAWAPSSRGR